MFFCRFRHRPSVRAQSSSNSCCSSNSSCIDSDSAIPDPKSFSRAYGVHGASSALVNLGH